MASQPIPRRALDVHVTLRATAVATAALLLTAGPVGATSAAPDRPGRSDAATAATASGPPSIYFTVSAARTRVSRAKLTQRPGYLNIRLKAQGRDERELSIYKLRKGYSQKDVTRDFPALVRVSEGSTRTKDRTAVRRLMENVVVVGGVIAQPGQTSGTIIKFTPGKYYVDDNLSEGSERTKVLKVTDTKSNGDGPGRSPAGTISMTKSKTISSPATFPKNAVVRIRNTAKGLRWYQLRVQQVADGTTAQQVAGFFSGENPDGSFFLDAVAGTSTLSAGRGQRLGWDLPTGTYALICYFPDPDKPGTVYAGNGMVRMITLT